MRRRTADIAASRKTARMIRRCKACPAALDRRARKPSRGFGETQTERREGPFAGPADLAERQSMLCKRSVLTTGRSPAYAVPGFPGAVVLDANLHYPTRGLHNRNVSTT